MLEIFISFTVDAVKRDTVSIASELRLVGEDMKEMHEMNVLSSGKPPFPWLIPITQRFRAKGYYPFP
jgi:hypothetical protein